MDRDLVFKRECSYSFICKLLVIILNYISIPMYLEVLGSRDYGIWMTIFSVVNWIYILDLGIGNGLGNKLTETISLKKHAEVKSYIITGYIVLGSISLLLLIIGLILIGKLELSEFFNISFYSEKYIKKIFTIVFSITIINFTAMLYIKLYSAKQRQSLNNIFSLIIQVLMIFLLFSLGKYKKIDLEIIAFLYPGINLLISLIATICFFIWNKNLKPNIKDFDSTKINSITGTGIGFFLIQICCLIIFNTNNILILKYNGAEAVTNYVLVSRFFLLIKMVVALVLNPMWPLFTDAYIKNDVYWLKKTFKNLYKLYILLIIGIIITIILLPYILKFWLGENIVVSNNILILWGICILVSEFAGIHIIFVNAIGKIKLQMFLYLVGGFIYFPLTILLIKKYDIEGVVLGMIVSVLPLTIFIPIQVRKILKNMTIQKEGR